MLFGSSVEFFSLFYWRFSHNLCTNKQYPTLAVIYQERYMTMQVMNVFAYPCANVNLRDSQ